MTLIDEIEFVPDLRSSFLDSFHDDGRRVVFFPDLITSGLHSEFFLRKC